uniref:Restriction system protein n=1 Tax=Candidatus Kentrum sp. DK TaxID=2126562 RepID=A0A450SDN3_9GAMM|nr:MAG: restriction system protein [Candidatus Kentron sp. DK]VFJ54544.1 MAG: restriction system protein [Candidatus Kentron sp. DK]
MPKGPQFLRFAVPILEALNRLGGSGKPGEVADAIIEALEIPEEQLAETIKDGSSRIKGEISWARFYLARAGYLDASERGVWRLTRQGENAHLSEPDVYRMFKETHAKLPRKTASGKKETDSDDIGAEDVTGDPEQEITLLDVLLSLSPGGFERICQLMLRKSGFEKVEVTGQSGDGGIDGHGVLQVNPFVSFKVLFQCKRYADNPVSAFHVRDFRGAMMGRADKGIIISTGRFTADAQKEARRDGAPPIELVDGEKLVSMFQDLQLGVRPKTVYEVDEKFFDDYR